MVATGAVGPVAGVPAAAGAAGFGMAQVGFGSTYLSTAAPMMSDATSATSSLAVPETMCCQAWESLPVERQLRNTPYPKFAS